MFPRALLWLSTSLFVKMPCIGYIIMGGVFMPVSDVVFANLRVL